MADLINVGTAENDGTGDKLRDAFIKLNQAYADSPKPSKSTGTIDIKPDNSGGFPTAILSSFTGQATTNLTDGNEHAVQFVLEAGGDWTAATDSRMWYLHVAELGNIDGASGVIAVDMMKQWISNGNIVTIKYDATPKRFHVTKVEGHHVLPASVPAIPTADGDYKLHINGGVATWVTI